ncbi:MAG: GNAT family N-acetyltransferase [Candidatus Sericytochromatia bacterium]|nr:GNAT family N-acetyltransferase [Candidatus Sericytochromatia bacterium]
MTWRIESSSNSSDEQRFLRRMFERAALASHPGLHKLGRISQREQLDALFEDQWDSPRRHLLFAKTASNAWAGALWLRSEIHPVSEDPVWLIVCLAVEAGFQRQGAGRALLEAAQRFVANNRPAALRLFTHTCNAEAIALYRACGFSPQAVEYTWQATDRSGC